MKTPQADYDLAGNSVKYEHIPGVVWAAILDRRYKLEVVRNDSDPRTGQFTIYDGEANDAVIYDDYTGLSYGATFGADIIDVAHWQDTAIKLVDTR